MNSRILFFTLVLCRALTISGQTIEPDLRPQVAPDRALLSPRENPERETRRHWATVRNDGATLHEVTTIHRSSEEVTSTVAIVRDPKGQAWLFEDIHDYSRHSVLYQITHVATGEFVSLGFKTPFKATTRSGMLREAGSETHDRDVDTTVSTRLISRTAPESQWENVDQSAEWRSEIRTSMTTAFLDALEQMRDTLLRHDEDFITFSGLARLLSYAPECETSVRVVRVERLWPDCKFDKELGRPCSTEQVNRVERARKKGVIPPLY